MRRYGVTAVQPDPIAGDWSERGTRRYGRAVLVGLGLFAVGFGAMNLFWWLGDWRRDVPGLWDYRSATIGDGLLLPVAAGILVAAGDHLPPAPNESWVISIAATAGALVAAAVQVASLLDPAPQPNWTSPAPHTLNVAGWYHGALLVTASGFFSGWSVRLLWRARIHRSVQPERVAAMLRSPATTVLVACLTGFMGLVVVDMSSIRGTTTGVAVIGVALGAAPLTVGLLVWGFGHEAVKAWHRVAAGVVLAIGLCAVAR
jgi:hypothetical protein